MTSRFEPETKAWACTELAIVIAQAYSGWATRQAFDPKAKEPTLTVAALTDDLDQHASPIDYRCSPRSWRTSLVRTQLDSMVRKGKLTISLGPSDHRPEVRCYEPAAR